MKEGAYMSFASRHNQTDYWGIDTTGFTYHSCKEMYGKNGPDFIYPVIGLFVNSKNNSQFGPSNIIITKDTDGGFFLNAPANWYDMFVDIIANTEDVEAIKEGKVGFTIRQFKAHGRICHAPYWVDMA